MLYKKSVKNFLSTKYSNQHYFSIQTSFDGKEYICNTCNSKVKQGKVPCQAVINNMYVDDTPVELASLEKLEQILIAQRILYEKIIVSYAQSEEDDPELHNLVKTYQKHTHSRSCRKYKNIQCRFNFGQFFTNTTIVAEPLSDDLDEAIKSDLQDKHKETLSLVKQQINAVLNPSKPNYDSTLTEDDIFNLTGINKEAYYSALSISPDSNYELHLK